MPDTDRAVIPRESALGRSDARGPNMKREVPETLNGKTLNTGEGTSKFLKCGRQPSEKAQKIL